MDEPFTIFLEGKTMGGYTTFWRSNNVYYYQSDGIGEPTRCSQALYEEARKLWAEKNGAVGLVR